MSCSRRPAPGTEKAGVGSEKRRTARAARPVGIRAISVVDGGIGSKAICKQNVSRAAAHA